MRIAFCISILSMSAALFLGASAYAGSTTPSPNASAATDNDDSEVISTDSRIGHIYLVNKDQRFFKFNSATGGNDEVIIPKGTRIRLDNIIETAASRKRKSYWNFTVVDSAISIYTQPVGTEIWIIKKKIPSSLAHVESTPQPSQPPQIAAPEAPKEKPQQVYSFPFELVQKQEVLNMNPDVTDDPQAANVNDADEDNLDQTAIFSITPGLVWAPLCTNFLDERGNAGPWGQAIINSLASGNNSLLLDGTKMSDLKSMCPAFDSFNVESKQKFWAFFVASMAMSESSCRPRKRARGPNGTAAGLLQLHLGHEGKYGCPGARSLNPESSVKCGLTMLKNQVIKYGNLFVQPGNTYWQVLWSNTKIARKLRARVAISQSCQAAGTKK